MFEFAMLESIPWVLGLKEVYFVIFLIGLPVYYFLIYKLCAACSLYKCKCNAQAVLNTIKKIIKSMWFGQNPSDQTNLAICVCVFFLFFLLPLVSGDIIWNMFFFFLAHNWTEINLFYYGYFSVPDWVQHFVQVRETLLCYLSSPLMF